MTAPCAIYLGATEIGLKQNPFGKDVANLGLYRALARYAPGDELPFLAFEKLENALVAGELYQDRPHTKTITTTSIFNTPVVTAAGTLVRGGPFLSDLAWMRRKAGDRAYSITGLIHSLAPPAMREFIAKNITAPIQSWDTLWCTSPSVREALIEMFEGYADFLASRFGGGKPRPFPAMPVIPLGIEVDEIQARLAGAGPRESMRKELGIAEDEIVVLWVGRLSFVEKAHPSSMFLALEEAARRTGARIRMLNVGWFAGGEFHQELYEEAARVHAPTVRVDFHDGNDRAFVDRVWSAADIFISLVDNIQETFGITPIEAMAAGLPVVLSDWDGYRANVTHGTEGFLIPTLLPSSETGWLMSQRQILGMDAYQSYTGSIALHTAVEMDGAVDALEALIREPGLRRRMGDAGRIRARNSFNWPVVIEQLCAHWTEQAARRRSAASHDAAPELFLDNPVKNNPLKAFRGFATRSLSPESLVSVRGEDPESRLQEAMSARINRAAEGYRGRGGSDALAHLVANGPTRLGDLTEALGRPADQVEFLVAWMAKMGVVAVD
jgi:glycosyltransferase involved in cell wall biosynthesis